MLSEYPRLTYHIVWRYRGTPLPKGSIKIPLYVSCISGPFYCGVNVLRNSPGSTFLLKCNLRFLVLTLSLDFGITCKQRLSPI